MTDPVRASVRKVVSFTSSLLLATLIADRVEAQTGEAPEPLQTAEVAAPLAEPATGEGQVASPPEDLPVNPQLPQPPSPTTTPPEAPSWPRNLTVGGGAILWYYQPFLTGAKNDVQIFFANLVLDAKLGRFGFHAEPRIRDSKMRSFFAGPAWVQEVYAHTTWGGDDHALVLKLGKAYAHFGLFWDNSFYGNVQVYDGLKLDPDFGVSAEGNWGAKQAFGLRYWAQYFIVDGLTNVSLPGRDTFSIAGARRRNQLIGRAEPFLTLGPSGVAKLGLSAEFLQADLPVVGKQDVFRGAGDVTVSVSGLTLWGEFIRQNGQTVTAFPIAAAPDGSTPGQASKHVNYLLAGGEYTYGLATARYVFSWGDYHDVAVKETMHVPAVGVALDPGLSLLAELVIWERHAGGATTFIDRSLNVTLYGHF